jgi:hypothetical protein
MHLEPFKGIKPVPFGNVTMYVYADNDIVSKSISGTHHTWEATEVQQMLWAMQQYNVEARVSAEYQLGEGFSREGLQQSRV